MASPLGRWNGPTGPFRAFRTLLGESRRVGTETRRDALRYGVLAARVARNEARRDRYYSRRFVPNEALDRATD